jgi:hypothetical protein
MESWIWNDVREFRDCWRVLGLKHGNRKSSERWQAFYNAARDNQLLIVLDPSCFLQGADRIKVSDILFARQDYLKRIINAAPPDEHDL